MGQFTKGLPDGSTTKSFLFIWKCFLCGIFSSPREPCQWNWEQRPTDCRSPCVCRCAALTFQWPVENVLSTQEASVLVALLQRKMMQRHDVHKTLVLTLTKFRRLTSYVKRDTGNFWQPILFFGLLSLACRLHNLRLKVQIRPFHLSAFVAPEQCVFFFASFLRHSSLAVAGLREPLSRFLEGVLYKYPERMKLNQIASNKPVYTNFSLT